MAEPFIGEIDLYGFLFAPENWAECKGQTLQINQQQALFALLGTAYGGDGRSTFSLPDLRGRLPVGMGLFPSSGFDWRMGQTSGSETHKLKVTELAKHAHPASFTSVSSSTDGSSFTASTDAGSSAIPVTGGYLAAATPPSSSGPDKAELIYKSNPASHSLVNLGGGYEGAGSILSGTVAVENNGSGEKFFIIQTSQVLNWCISMQGLFPSRN